MNRITEYQILRDPRVQGLVDQVENHITRGWQPLGEPYVQVWTEGENEIVHYQAIVKYEESKK